jgi:DNA-binding MarR family transcriptional regulator
MTEPARRVQPDRVVHEPGRLAILVVLGAVEEADFLFLMEQTGLTKGNLSSHTAKLEDAGYIEIEKQLAGRVPRTVYRITPKGTAAVRAYRDHMIHVLGSVG